MLNLQKGLGLADVFIFQAQKSPLLEPASLFEVAQGKYPLPAASGQRAKKQRPKLQFVFCC